MKALKGQQAPRWQGVLVREKRNPDGNHRFRPGAGETLAGISARHQDQFGWNAAAMSRIRWA